jgi:hypothetical protein
LLKKSLEYLVLIDKNKNFIFQKRVTVLFLINKEN